MNLGQGGRVKGILLIRLEVESGLLDLVIMPDVYARHCSVLRHQQRLIVVGIVQRVKEARRGLVD